MKLQRIEGGWYADNLPSGAFVVRMADHLLTDRGRVDWTNGGPEGGLLFPRLSEPNGLAFAGQGQRDGSGAWEYRFDDPIAKWAQIDTVCIGTSPVIWCKGQWLVSHGGEVGVQGYRYCDPVTGEAVSGDAATVGHGLYEYSDLGHGLIVGQGPKDSCWLKGPDGKYRKIIPGTTLAIRAHRDGDNISVACWVKDEPAALLWATVDELLALPSQDAPDPDVPVIVPPPALIPLPDLGPLAPCWTGPVIERKGQQTPAFGNASWSDAPQFPRDRPVAEWFGLSADWDTGGRPALCGVVSTEDKELQAG